MDGERVPQVVQPWPALARCVADPGSTRQPQESADHPGVRTCAVSCVDEEGRVGIGAVAALATGVGVRRERTRRVRLQRNGSRFIKLAVANDQHAVIQIDVRETEAQRFRHAESRAIQHAEQGDECPGTQRADGRQAGGFPEQRLDLGRRVNVGAEGRDEPRPGMYVCGD